MVLYLWNRTTTTCAPLVLLLLRLDSSQSSRLGPPNPIPQAISSVCLMQASTYVLCICTASYVNREGEGETKKETTPRLRRSAESHRPVLD
ncbi:hypothetical protein B0T17DRAFT_539573 [Bombardia bombarda]|uniref:Secreted protein n=1 Tax=Bombardia bombarda TaxID=252184 RepID=A0AA39WIA1_9PEZI|nr:hypothetical protein B0T17DRAFT_539573 [Bombardia bombarda]